MSSSSTSTTPTTASTGVERDVGPARGGGFLAAAAARSSGVLPLMSSRRMASVPASIASCSRPSLIRGAMTSRITWADCTSVSAPPTPLPVSMRTLRSPVAITSSTPVSLPFVPTPHVLKASYATSSIVLPCRLGVA